MHKVSEEEIDFMSDDLENKGILNADLREDLIDHLCCIIEEEMEEGSDFNTFYKSILPRFFKKELSEIQRETNNLLKFKYYYSMKRTLNISALLTVIFTFLGAILKTFHLPGAGVTIVLGGFFFSFVFLPLLIILKFKDEDSKTDKAVFSFGLAIAILLSIGLIFKLMHWPGANVLMIGSTVVFTFVYVPLYFFTRFNRPELRFNTVTNTVMMFACGGIFFALFNLSFSQRYSKELSQNHFFIHENSLRIIDANKELFSTYSSSEEALQLHQKSLEMDEMLEKIAATVVNGEIDNINEDKSQLESMVSAYNQMLENTAFEGLIKIEDRGIKVMDRLSAQLILNTLARLQQQVAVNENTYLSSQIKK